jgi:DNA-binding phage protein
MAYTLNRRAILQAALEHDLTIVDLAEKAGVHRVTLHKALSLNDPSEPTLRTVVGLSRVLDLPVESLLQAS